MQGTVLLSPVLYALEQQFLASCWGLLETEVLTDNEPLIVHTYLPIMTWVMKATLPQAQHSYGRHLGGGWSQTWALWHIPPRGEGMTAPVFILLSYVSMLEEASLLLDTLATLESPLQSTKWIAMEFTGCVDIWVVLLPSKWWSSLECYCYPFFNQDVPD